MLRWATVSVTRGSRYAWHGLIFLLLLIGALPVLATDFGMTPSLLLREEYNSNVGLLRGAGEGHFLQLFSPAINLYARRSNWHADSRLGYEKRIYSGNDRLDSDNWSWVVNAQRQWGEDQWWLTSKLEQRSTLESELLTSGLTQLSLHRYQRQINPGWQRQLSRKTRLAADIDYMIVSYQGNSSTTGLLDYRLLQGNVNLSHDWGRRDRSRLTLSALSYETDDGQIKADDLSVLVTQIRDFSALSEFSLALGLRQSTTTARQGIALPELSERQTGGLLAFQWQRHFVHADSQLKYTRSLDPGSAGRLQSSDRIDGFYKHRLSAHLSLRLDMTFMRREDLASNLLNSRLDRQFYRFSPSIAWRFTRSWRLRGYFTYMRQKYDAFAEGAISRALGLVLYYQRQDR